MLARIHTIYDCRAFYDLINDASPQTVKKRADVAEKPRDAHLNRKLCISSVCSFVCLLANSLASLDITTYTVPTYKEFHMEPLMVHCLGNYMEPF